jgi:hypothetical protein
MSSKGTLTREQAIQAVGIELVNKVDGMNCEPTNRVQTDGDNSVEYSASVETGNDEYGHMTLTAYYYQSPADLDGVEDLSNLEWTVASYGLT